MSNFKALIASLIAGAIILPASAAGSWKTRTYDANYSVQSNAGASTYRMAADGHGHARIESHTHGMSSVIIMDEPAKAMYIITTMPNGQTMAMKQPYDPSKMSSTSEDLKNQGATPLGAKNVAGHPCHGYKTSTGESWIGDDIDCMVSASNQSPRGSTSMTLQSYSPNAPAASQFALPPGTKLMSIPGQ